jgi:hypothetical protein
MKPGWMSPRAQRQSGAISVSGDELPTVACMAASMKVAGFDSIEAITRAR